MYYGYRSPPGFDWDTNENDDPIVDNKDLSTYNLDAKLALFMNWTTDMS